MVRIFFWKADRRFQNQQGLTNRATIAVSQERAWKLKYSHGDDNGHGQKNRSPSTDVEGKKVKAEFGIPGPFWSSPEANTNYGWRKKTPDLATLASHVKKIKRPQNIKLV